MVALATFSGRFIKENPDISLDICESHGWSQVSEIESGRADLGLSLSVSDVPSTITKIPYKSANLVVAMPKNHILATRPLVTFEDLIEFEHVTFGPKSGLHLFMSNLATQMGHELKYRMVSSFDAMYSMISAGLGIGVLTEVMITPFIQSLDIVTLPLHEDWAQRNIRIIYKEDFIPPPG